MLRRFSGGSRRGPWGHRPLYNWPKSCKISPFHTNFGLYAPLPDHPGSAPGVNHHRTELVVFLLRPLITQPSWHSESGLWLWCKGSPVQFPVLPEHLFPLLLAPLLHLTCGAGAVDDKDLAVSSDQGNAWLFVHPTLGIMDFEVVKKCFDRVCVWKLMDH